MLGNEKTMYSHPPISVLIRTFNSEKTLRDVISYLDLGDDDECVIVDSGSTDSTLSIAKEFGAIVVVLEQPFNYSRALNKGFEIAKNELVVVLSSHCIPLRKDLLSRLRGVAVASNPEVAVFYGKTVFYDPGKTTPEILTGGYADWKERRFNPGGNGFAMYPKTAWQLRKFDESLVTAEDLDWLDHELRSGKKAVVIPDALVLYRNQGPLKHMFRKGWHEARLGREFEGTTTTRSPLYRAAYHFSLNALNLTKNLVQGKFGFKHWSRMCAHGLGAALASTSQPSARNNNRSNKDKIG